MRSTSTGARKVNGGRPQLRRLCHARDARRRHRPPIRTGLRSPPRLPQGPGPRSRFPGPRSRCGAARCRVSRYTDAARSAPRSSSPASRVGWIRRETAEETLRCARRTSYTDAARSAPRSSSPASRVGWIRRETAEETLRCARRMSYADAARSAPRSSSPASRVGMDPPRDGRGDAPLRAPNAPEGSLRPGDGLQLGAVGEHELHEGAGRRGRHPAEEDHRDRPSEAVPGHGELHEPALRNLLPHRPGR